MESFLGQDHTLVNQGGLPGRGSGVSGGLQCGSVALLFSSQQSTLISTKGHKMGFDSMGR